MALDAKARLDEVRKLADYFESRKIDPRDALGILAATLSLLVQFMGGDQDTVQRLTAAAWNTYCSPSLSRSLNTWPGEEEH